MDKKRLNTMLLQETYFSFKDTHRLKVKDGKRYSLHVENKSEQE